MAAIRQSAERSWFFDHNAILIGADAIQHFNDSNYVPQVERLFLWLSVLNVQAEHCPAAGAVGGEVT